MAGIFYFFYEKSKKNSRYNKRFFSGKTFHKLFKNKSLVYFYLAFVVFDS